MKTSQEARLLLHEKPVARRKRTLDVVTDAIVQPLHKRPRMSRMLLFVPSILWILLFVLVPLAVIFVISFWKTKAWTLIKGFYLDNYVSMIKDPTYLKIIPWTLLIVLVMVVLCGVLGCLCQSKTGPFDHRKEAHLKPLDNNVIIENRPT